MGDGVPTDPSGRGAPVPGGGGSGHAPQDPATSALSPFAWQGGPLTGPLGALLAAAGAPPGLGTGAWPGFLTSTGASPGLGAGAWPFFPGAGAPPGGAAKNSQAAGSTGGGTALAGLAAGAWPPSAAMAGGGTGPAVHGGLQDWFAGAATAALGPEWLCADLGTSGGVTRASSSTTKATPSQGIDVDEDNERLPVRAASSPIRGSSSRQRRGGRAPRPPPASRTAQASVDVDLTNPSLADWCDENTRIVCEIFADEVLKVNRSSTHLSKTGYKNVIERFKDITGIDYTRKQFKNKWDKCKQDYDIWKRLTTKETGIGWDESKKNIVMTEAWWKKVSQDIKGCTRFKLKGLQNEEQLSIMFEDLRNTGDDHWSASSGIAPSSANSPIPVDDEDELEHDDDSDPEEVTTMSLPSSKRGRGARNKKEKKAKTSTGHWLQEEMGKLVKMNERTTASCESIARREDTSGCSIKDVMTLVKSCGAVPSTNEHFDATLLFTNRSEREMFMTMDTPEERFDWLKRKYEWMIRNDVPK